MRTLMFVSITEEEGNNHFWYRPILIQFNSVGADKFFIWSGLENILDSSKGTCFKIEFNDDSIFNLKSKVSSVFYFILHIYRLFGMNRYCCITLHTEMWCFCDWQFVRFASWGSSICLIYANSSTLFCKIMQVGTLSSLLFKQWFNRRLC